MKPVVSALTLLSLASLISCGKQTHNGNATPGKNVSNASLVDSTDFNPTQTSPLTSLQLASALQSVSVPTPPMMRSSAFGLVTTDQKVDGSLSDAFNSCMSTVKPTIDTVSASGSAFTYHMQSDWSACFSDALTSKGMKVDVSQCDYDSLLHVECPGADFGSAHGKTAADAAASLGGGMIGCVLSSGNVGSVKKSSDATCRASGTNKNGQPVAMELTERSAVISSTGSACRVATIGAQNVFDDCLSGLSRKSSETTNGKTTSEFSISKFTFTGAMYNLGVASFVQNQVLPFEVNNWHGNATVSGSRATYILGTASMSTTGVINP